MARKNNVKEFPEPGAEVLEVPASILTDEMGDGPFALNPLCAGTPQPIRLKMTIEAEMRPTHMLRIDGQWHLVFDFTADGNYFGFAVKTGVGCPIEFPDAANLLSDVVE